MSAVKGWCPGAHRPMLTGDGLLVRIRPHGGVLTDAAMLGIADCAAQFGSGLIEVTSRANVQIRGVTEATYTPLIAALGTLGLLDPDAGSENRRNVLASPLAGCDPRARLDIRPAVTALEAALTADTSLAALPAKFGFVIEDGGSFDLSDVDADVRFTALQAEEAIYFAVSIPDGTDGDWIIHMCAPETAPSLALKIARTFTDLSQGRQATRRMRDLIGHIGLAHFVDALDLENGPLPPFQSRTARHSGADCLGFHADARFTGVAMPFGRWTAGSFRGLAEAARRFGCGELRLTPWRAILIPGVAAEASAKLHETLTALGGILDPADPRLAVIACPGAPYCLSATTATQTDALALAAAARRLTPTGIALHVSGCAKGCARRAAAPATLIGNDGRYDLVFDGNAQDSPHLHKLSLDDAARLLCERAEQMNESAAL
ncbi:precorrin-3B synthase [Methylovirgula sp. 4M-Z18]|uniref:precorrin-3B synthase n=1 Tax=Methylovirgula sp. 4M-Z18 TaxID=2293567 RepID=UPI000E2EE733|nr:precorrin-3B synthase [Methylovirgula sp. 4M-Z18]RFB76298.1 precorrin-3B synthase [Methylovirgula sp. 4M-Z18]